MNSFIINIILPILFVVFSYFSGSIPTGVIYSNLVHKTDVRNLGSGNSGATNIGRNFGFKAAVIVTIIDVLKGLIPMALAKLLFPDQHLLIMTVGFASIIGHAYPLWVEFRGGKVVATSIGVFIAFDFWLAIVLVATFALILFITSTVSFASMTSYTTIAIYNALTNPIWIYKIGFLLVASFLIYRHRENVKRLLKQEESRINWGLYPNKTKPKK